MAQLIKQEKHFGNHIHIYQISIPAFSGAHNPQLVSCYLLCQNPEIQITDIMISSVNKNTGYNVAWQRCVRYDKDDFQNSFSNIKEFLSEHDNKKFADWCVIFKWNEKEYSLTEKAESDELKFSCSCEIGSNVFSLVKWLEAKMKEMEI